MVSLRTVLVLAAAGLSQAQTTTTPAGAAATDDGSEYVVNYGGTVDPTDSSLEHQCASTGGREEANYTIPASDVQYTLEEAAEAIKTYCAGGIQLTYGQFKGMQTITVSDGVQMDVDVDFGLYGECTVPPSDPNYLVPEDECVEKLTHAAGWCQANSDIQYGDGMLWVRQHVDCLYFMIRRAWDINVQ